MTQRVLLIVLIFSSFLVSADDTVLKLYRPFGDGQSSPKIIKHVPGRCDRQSHLILREDAWRCEAEGRTFDPCFAKVGTKNTSVLCPSSPWSMENTQINVSAPLDNEDHLALDMSRTFPWGIELANGNRCLAVEATEYYDSMPIRYHCSSNVDLLGTIQRCNPVWSTLKKNADEITTVKLSKAWF
jgi:hypothetical protein